jgi:murein DD-endopeptidase MepM/ murein hydrolase activator NlpD
MAAKRAFVSLLMIGLCEFACFPGNNHGGEREVICKPGEARYVLPYPVGMAYTCSQGFNGSLSHYGVFSYAVDFSMPIGSIVSAASDGIVEFTDGHYTDDDQTPGHENLVIVRHNDGTYARYVHLTHDGIMVARGQNVTGGMALGKSGSSGTFSPHLHFDVTSGGGTRDYQTIPVCFRNTIPHPYGPEEGVTYPANPY